MRILQKGIILLGVQAGTTDVLPMLITICYMQHSLASFTNLSSNVEANCRIRKYFSKRFARVVGQNSGPLSNTAYSNSLLFASAAKRLSSNERLTFWEHDISMGGDRLKVPYMHGMFPQN